MTENLAKERVKIDGTTLEWEPQLDTALPIIGTELPDFAAWINWNGFNLDRDRRIGHEGYDFAAYLTKNKEIVLGLPENTQIRAVADGYIKHFGWEHGVHPYAGYVEIEHNPDQRGMISLYLHVVPKVDYGQKVKKGDVIATLYKDPGEDRGRLTHLHLGLFSAMGTRKTSLNGGLPLVNRLDDPGLIDKSIYRYQASPQGDLNFGVRSLPGAKILQSYFKEMYVNDSERRVTKLHSF